MVEDLWTTDTDYWIQDTDWAIEISYQIQTQYEKRRGARRLEQVQLSIPWSEEELMILAKTYYFLL